MSEQNWKRTYILDVGPQGGTGIRIGNTEGTDEKDVLRIAFSIDKTDTAASNNAKIQIWNLSPDSLRVLDEADCVAILRAGYGKNMPLVMAGTVTSVVTEPDNANRVTTLEVVDGRKELRDTDIVFSFDGKVNSKEIYERIAQEMGLTLEMAEDLTFQDFPNGLQFTGKGKDALQRVVDANDHAWSIQMGILQIYWKGRPVSQKVYLLTSDTGLIGIPKKITVSENNDNNANLTGYEIDYLMNAAIGVNEMVQIQSGTANGYYRVFKLNQAGDNYDGDWQCHAQVLEVKPLPALDKKANDAINGTTNNVPINSGDTVKITNTFTQSNQTKAYGYDGSAFSVKEATYNVISVDGDKVTLGVGNSIVGTVKKSDVQKV